LNVSSFIGVLVLYPDELICNENTYFDEKDLLVATENFINKGGKDGFHA
jgi:hypothetical protein